MVVHSKHHATPAYAQEQNQVHAARSPPPGLAAPAMPPGTFWRSPPAPPGLGLQGYGALSHLSPLHCPDLSALHAMSNCTTPAQEVWKLDMSNCTTPAQEVLKLDSLNGSYEAGKIFQAASNCTKPAQEVLKLDSLNGSYEAGKIFQAAMKSPIDEPPMADVCELASLCAKEKERGSTCEFTISRSPNGSLIISWPIDSRKLRSKDRQAVSQLFEVAPGWKCKFIVKPSLPKSRQGKEGRGQACFQTAKGFGIVELKLVESDECSTASLGVSCLLSVNEQLARGPFQVNSDSADGSMIQGLPKGQDEWNLLSGGEKPCVVKLEVLPVSAKELSEATPALSHALVMRGTTHAAAAAA